MLVKVVEPPSGIVWVTPPKVTWETLASSAPTLSAPAPVTASPVIRLPVMTSPTCGSDGVKITSSSATGPSSWTLTVMVPSAVRSSGVKIV